MPCCDTQTKMIDGTATEEEITEHNLTDKEFATPDYAFAGDFANRLKYREVLNKNGLEVN